MSRIGKQPIKIPAGVKVIVESQKVQVEGPKGKMDYDVHPDVEVKVVESELLCSLRDGAPKSRPFYGLARSILDGLVHGVSVGFKKELEIKGVGFRAVLKGKILELSLGFSHVVNFPIPDGIEIKIEKGVRLSVEGASKQLVGQVAAEIRAFREPEPYKGKGVKYIDEHVRRKAGKAAGAA